MTLLPFLLLSLSPAFASVDAGAQGRMRGVASPAMSGLSASGLSPYPGDGRLPSRIEDDSSVDMAQMTIEQRVVIRVPMMRRNAAGGNAGAMGFAPPPRPVEWEERKGPKCVQIDQLRAAAVTTSRGVDLLMRNNRRLRARLSRECRPEDMYSGFYLQPNSDGAACAGRDRLLARSGANCLITEIKSLVPVD